MADVPCNGCTLCCQGDLIRLLPGDDPSRYQTMPHPLMQGATALAMNAQGSCVYLGRTGCTIHADRPRMCRTLDCRNLARHFDHQQAKKLDERGALRIQVWKRGRDLWRQTIKEQANG